MSGPAVERKPPNTASPRPPSCVTLSPQQIEALSRFYEMGLTPVDQELLAALRELTALRNSHASHLLALAKAKTECDALRDELDLTKAGLEFAKDAAFRLSGIAAEQYSKTDVEAICSIAIAALNRQHGVALAKAREALADARMRFANMANEAYAARNAKPFYEANKGWMTRAQVHAQQGRDAMEAALLSLPPQTEAR